VEGEGLGENGEGRGDRESGGQAKSSRRGREMDGFRDREGGQGERAIKEKRGSGKKGKERLI